MTDIVLVIPAPNSTVLVLPGSSGPAGRSASQSAAVGFVAAFKANEKLPGFAMVGSASWTAADCEAKCDIAPTAAATFLITKNGATVGSVVFAAGALAGVVTFTDPSVANGDVIGFFAPPSVDATLQGFYLTLAS